MRLAGGGASDVLLFGGRTVVRIPRHPVVAARFRAGAAAIAALAGRLPVPVPRIRAHAGPPAMECYPLLPGRAPVAAEAGPELARDIARFLASLHATPLEPLAGSPVVPGFWAGFLDDIEAALAAGGVDATTMAAIGRDFALARDPADALPPTLVHHDLHRGNLLVAGDPPRLAGVIDFADVSIEDPHWDFRHLADLGAGFLGLVIADYQARTGRRLSLRRIERLRACRGGLDLAKRLALDLRQSALLDGCTGPPGTPS